MNVNAAMKSAQATLIHALMVMPTWRVAFTPWASVSSMCASSLPGVAWSSSLTWRAWSRRWAWNSRSQASCFNDTDLV